MASSSQSPVSDTQDKDLSSQSLQFRNILLDTKARAGMQDMRLTGQFTDIILVAETVEFKAHKLVLANERLSVSDYISAFRALHWFQLGTTIMDDMTNYI